MKKIYFAGGCFWGVEHFLSLIKGVKNTCVGYGNSDIADPSYEDLKAKRSLAAETVEVEYDENIISLEELLELFIAIIDPAAIDRQGHDIGHQYRTGIYYTDINDEKIIKERMERLNSELDGKLATEVMKLENFYKAEEYHQDYLIKNPNGYCHLGPQFFELAKNYKKD